MPQDAFTIKHTAKALNETLIGAKTERIIQPTKDSVIFFLHKNGKNYKLLINANANYARICITNDNPQAPLTTPSFCMLLRKYLLRSTILKIETVEYERIAFVDLLCKDDLGETSEKRLYCEIMGKYSNVTLTDSGKILGALKVTGMDEKLLRPIYPGAKYILPSPQDKCEISDELKANETLLSLENASDFYKFIFEKFKGVSQLTALDIHGRFRRGP